VNIGSCKRGDVVFVTFPISERTVKDKIAGVDYTYIVKGNTGFREGQPGSRFDYNNLVYGTLAAVVKGITGKEGSEFLQERLFKPIGVKYASSTHLKDYIQVRRMHFIEGLSPQEISRKTGLHPI